MVLAAHLVHRWTSSDGGVGTPAAKFVSLPCDLDIATLDTRYGAGVANAIGGANPNDWYCAPVLAPIVCSPMGGRTFAHVVVVYAFHGFSGDSNSCNRLYILRPN